MPSKKPSRSRARRPGARKPARRSSAARKPARAAARKPARRTAAARKPARKASTTRKAVTRKPAARTTRKTATRTTRKTATRTTRKTATRTTASRKAASRTATSRKATPRKAAARKSSARKTTARSGGARTTTSRATASRARPRPRRDAATLFDPMTDDRDEYDMNHDQDQPENQTDDREEWSRPVAIGDRSRLSAFDEPVMPGDVAGSPGDEGTTSGDVAGPMPDEAAPAAYIHDEKPVIEDPRGETLVGVACAVLAAAVFLPWYRSFGQFDVSGWASGTWGPVVFFLALAGVAIVGLRRARVATAFPVSYSLLLEGIGWVSVLALLIKRFWAPDPFQVVGLSANPLKMGFWVALVAAVAVAMLASRLSRNTPIVVLPGWFRSKAGKLGAGLLALAVAGGAAFGLMNDFGDAAARARGLDGGSLVGQNGQTPEIEQGLPRCIQDLNFQTPQGVTAVSGLAAEASGVCTAQFESDQTLDAVAKGFRSAMQAAGWSFELIETDKEAAKVARQFAVTGPKCGTLHILEDSTNKVRTAAIVLGGEGYCEAFKQQQQQNPN